MIIRSTFNFWNTNSAAHLGVSKKPWGCALFGHSERTLLTREGVNKTGAMEFLLKPLDKL